MSRQNISLFATLFIAIALFAGASLRYTGFCTMPVFLNLFDDNAFLGIAAVGMTFVILSGGIDLSVGSMIGLTSILTGVLVEHHHVHPLVAAILMLVFGAACGTLMGVLIAKFEIAPFLVTLAGMFFLRGLAYTTSLESIPLSHPFYQWFSGLHIPVAGAALHSTALLFLLIVLAGIYMASSTRLGRSIYAIGGNAQSAQLMGLQVDRTLILIYTISGMLSALAGVAYTVYTSSGNATAAVGLELDVIAAVVIGGTLLTGGRGSVMGTLIGVLILGTIQTIVTFEATLSSWWTRIVIGVLLFVFVVLQKLLAQFGARLPMRSARRTAALALLLFFSLFSVTGHAALSPVQPTRLCPANQGVGAKIETGFYQLTGTELQVGQTDHLLYEEIPDPAPPYVTTQGEIEIYGSATYFIRYANWNEFLQGGCYDRVPLAMESPDGSRFAQQYSQPWDMRKFRFERAGQNASEIILGGAMSATGGKPFPVWPDDNPTRRIYIFRPDQAMNWVRDLFPVVGSVATGWIGHSYGGNFIQEDSELNVIRTDIAKAIGFFYEKVTDASSGTADKTELFATQMNSFEQPGQNPEYSILKIGDHPYPSLKRTIGGFLAEGPRPVQVLIDGQKFFIIGFSSGDFPTDGYTINYLWSRSLFGPYTPALNSNQSDLLDLGASIKQRYNLSWVGRPSFFVTPSGHYEMLFHGVRKDILPSNDYSKWPTQYNLWDFFRCIFKIDVQMHLDASGAPVISTQ